MGHRDRLDVSERFKNVAPAFCRLLSIRGCLVISELEGIGKEQGEAM